MGQSIGSTGGSHKQSGAVRQRDQAQRQEIVVSHCLMVPKAQVKHEPADQRAEDGTDRKPTGDCP